MPEGSYIIEMHRQRLRDLRRRATDAIRQMSDEDLNWRPNEESNSVANLVLHLAGNFRQRLVAGLLGQPDTRDRDAEFNERAFMTREQILAVWDGMLDEADRILAGLTPAQLDAPQMVRGQQLTVLDVLFTTATHLAEHVGQMLYIAKLRRGAEYQVVSIPHKKA